LVLNRRSFNEHLYNGEVKMAGNTNWNVTEPIDHTTIGDLPGEIRSLKSNTATIVAKEHDVPGTANSGGQHVKGSSRVYIGSGFPLTDPEGNSLATGADTSDNGRLAINTADSNDLRVYVATSVSVTAGWVVPKVNTMSLAAFGAWTTKNSGGIVALAKDKVYQVTGDGFVCAYGSTGASASTLELRNDSNATPNTVQQSHTIPANSIGAIMCPVRSGDYWRIYCSNVNSLAIYWIPLGGGVCNLQA
jgi:hypothetical protein